MEDVKVSNGADCQLEQKCDEKERFDKIYECDGANRRKVRAVSFAGFRLCCVEIRNLT